MGSLFGSRGEGIQPRANPRRADGRVTSNVAGRAPPGYRIVGTDFVGKADHEVSIIEKVDPTPAPAPAPAPAPTPAPSQTQQAIQGLNLASLLGSLIEGQNKAFERLSAPPPPPPPPPPPIPDQPQQRNQRVAQVRQETRSTAQQRRRPSVSNRRGTRGLAGVGASTTGQRTLLGS